MKLNLTVNNNSEQLVLEYLEANASEELANKINNGIQVNKDGKTLISKKTLSGFMKYANDEAKKSVKSGATYACIRDEEVFSWAIHYFEENDILGDLYNLDGTKYEAPKPVSKKKESKPEVIKPKEPAIKQLTLFDLMDMDSSPKQAVVEPNFHEDITPIVESNTTNTNAGIEIIDDDGVIKDIKPLDNASSDNALFDLFNM